MKITFCGQDFLLHPAGALLWPSRHILIVADLHLEKGSHYARRGYFLPPYDSRETLRRLLDVCAVTESRQVIVLGDGFHDNEGFDRLGAEEKIMFAQLCRYNLIWIKGNHDRDFVPPAIAAYEAHETGGIIFRHRAMKESQSEISGHYHPKVDIKHKGGIISCRCFIENGRKFILPAFGAYAGGLSIKDPAIASLSPNGFRYYALNNEKLFHFSNETGQERH